MIRLRYCTIDVGPEAVWTRFDDGTICPATPHPQMPDYREITARLGYGTDVWRYCLCHEVMHSFVAEWFYDAPSAVLWAIAHGKMLPGREAVAEEIMAQTAQRWIHGGERPIVGGVDWIAFKVKALELLDGT